eukprot:gene13350-16315_t
MRICYSPPVTRDTTDPAITDAPVFRIPRVSNTNDIASLQADYAYVTPQSQKPGEKAAHFLVDAVRQIVVGEMITTATTCTASAAIIDLLGDNSVSDMW